MSFEAILINTLMLLALGVPAFLLAKFKLVSSSAVKPLSIILLYVCQPFMLLKSFWTLEYQPDLLINILLSIAFSVACTILVWIVSLFVFHKKNLSDDKIYQFASMFSNCGFFGLPFLAALIPDNGYVILYASMYIVVFNVLSWTLGIYILTGDKKFVSLKKAFLNPAVVSVIIGIPLFMLNVKMPSQVIDFASYWSMMTSPLAMSVVGIRLADMPFSLLVKDGKAFAASGLRLVVSPLIMWVILLVVGVSDANLFNSMIIASAMPVATTTVVFAELYAPESSAGVTSMLLSTVLCVVTVPLICMLTLI